MSSSGIAAEPQGIAPQGITPQGITPQGMTAVNKTLQHKLRKQEAGERIYTSEPYKYGKYKGQPWSRLPNNLLIQISKDSADTIDGYTAAMVLEHRGVQKDMQKDNPLIRPTLHAIDRFSVRYIDRYIAYKEVEEIGMAAFISMMCAEAMEKGEKKIDNTGEYHTYTYLGVRWVVKPIEAQGQYTIITII